MGGQAGVWDREVGTGEVSGQEVWVAQGRVETDKSCTGCRLESPGACCVILGKSLVPGSSTENKMEQRSRVMGSGVKMLPEVTSSLTTLFQCPRDWPVAQRNTGNRYYGDGMVHSQLPTSFTTESQNAK